MLPYAFAKRHEVLQVGEKILISDPHNLEALEELRILLGHAIETSHCPREELLAKIEEAYREEIDPIEEEEADEIYDLHDPSATASTVKLVNHILAEAIRQGASDVHFEPEDGVRYRIDGVLVPRHKLPATGEIAARLKVMARLDIAEHRLPQDGRIKVQTGGREIDMRMSTLPTTSGERIVLRILDRKNILLGLDKLQIPQIETFRKLIHMAEGLLLVTGPTGSGKTTTLYSAIQEIASPKINIMTIEDPVEYKLPGIAQIGVHPKIGLSFATGLRHILRQDPDVIMIGEIRDRETAEIAIQASLTGHLVLSTLHTNDAPSAITRLVDMGIEPYLLASSLIGVLAQRLVRTICCEGGCNKCLGTGYRGRRGLYELMPITQPLRQEIAKGYARPDIPTLADHGAQLVQEGVTSQAEVLRVTRG